MILLLRTAVERADSGDHTRRRLDENRGKVTIELTSDALCKRVSTAAQINIGGARYPERLEEMTAR